MDKKTLIRNAQPAATFALAFSIISLPFIAKATTDIRGVISVYHENSCAN